MDGTGSGPYPMACFVIISVKPSGSITRTRVKITCSRPANFIQGAEITPCFNGLCNNQNCHMSCHIMSSEDQLSGAGYGDSS